MIFHFYLIREHASFDQVLRRLVNGEIVRFFVPNSFSGVNLHSFLFSLIESLKKMRMVFKLLL
jgi:hypothetical protein